MSAHTPESRLTGTTRDAVRRAIATDIYRAAERSPATLVADGGELATLLAERIIRRVEDHDTTPDTSR